MLEITLSEFSEKDLKIFVRRLSAYVQYFDDNGRPAVRDYFESIRRILADELTYRELFTAGSAGRTSVRLVGLESMSTEELTALAGWCAEMVPEVRKESGSLANLFYRLANCALSELLER